jgi:hypothetical protein
MEQRFVPEDASESGVGVEVVLIGPLSDAVRGRR